MVNRLLEVSCPCYSLGWSTRTACRSQSPRGLRRRSTAARPLRLWVRISPGTSMFVCCECCVLSVTGLCDGLITRPEESYRLWRVVVYDQETSRVRRLKARYGAVKNTTTMGCNAKKKRTRTACHDVATQELIINFDAQS
jgi:hypothetical protein